jgi:hypothetical protein
LKKIEKFGILILAFDRHESFNKILLNLLKNTKYKIFISIDGGRSLENHKVKKIAENSKKLYPERIELNSMKENNGVKFGVIKGIDWFFSNVDCGVILEEDLEILVKNPQTLFETFQKFFTFEKKSVINLSTFSYIKNIDPENKTHLKFYKCQDFYMWGWATHKNVWLEFKLNLSKIRINQFLKALPRSNMREKIYWIAIHRLVNKRQIDSWGYPFLFYSTARHRILVPSQPIVRNIGLSKGSNYSKASFFHHDLKNLNAKSFTVKKDMMKIMDQNIEAYIKNKKIRHNINYYSTLKALLWNIIPIRHLLKKIKK